MAIDRELLNLYLAWVEELGPDRRDDAAALAIGQWSGKQSPTRPQRLSVKQAADELNVSEDTVREMVKNGKLPALRYGGGRGVLRFDPAAVEAAGSEPRPSKPSEARRRRLLGI